MIDLEHFDGANDSIRRLIEMGRELQKRKNRSSIAKVRQKPKSKKKLLHHPVIAANWDNSQTMVQNYKRLGLAVKVNKATGGVDKTVEDLAEDEASDSLKIGALPKMEVKEARIERDAETGKILRVVDGIDEGVANPLNDPLNDIDSDSDDNNQSAAVPAAPKTAVVAQLEQEARRPENKYQRKQSQGERDFIEDLVRKYGDDYGKMARDTKINYMQRSAGDLKRRVKKWRESGGEV